MYFRLRLAIGLPANMDEERFANYFESERFLGEREDDEIHKSKDPEILNWDRIKLDNNSRFLNGDLEIYRLLQKGLKEQNPIYELDVDGKQHASAKILFLDKGALFLKESTKKSAEKEGFVYSLAKLCNINDYFEPTCGVIIGDSHYAVSQMMDKSMKSLTNWKKSLPEALDGLLQGAANAGISHKLAAFHYVTSNLDAHRSNVFSNGEQLKSIDAGRSFIPYGKVFIPGYLRKSDETVIKKGDDDSVRLWLGGLRSDSRLFIFHSFIDSLNLKYADNTCEKIANKWEELALGRK